MISRISARETHPPASSYWFITCCNYICVYICVCRLISHECKRSENWNANHGWGNRTVYATVLGFLRRVKLLAVRHRDLLGAECVCVYITYRMHDRWPRNICWCVCDAARQPRPPSAVCDIVRHSLNDADEQCRSLPRNLCGLRSFCHGA